MSIPEITVEQLVQKIGAGGVMLFDVRNPDEFERVRIAGAKLVPLGEVVDRVEEFPKDREVLVMCKVGGRSARAVEFLRSCGVDAVNIEGGILAWIEAGNPVDGGGMP